MNPFRKPPRLNLCYKSLSDQLEEALLQAKRILVLDDDSSLLDLVKVISEKYEIELVVARTSGAARIRLSSECFDAAILDVGVANGDGIDLYRWIVASLPQLKVFFLTGAPVEMIADKVHAVGSAPVYSKPTFFGGGFMEDLFEKLGARRKVNPA